MKDYLPAIIAALIAALSYLVIHFWMKPLLEYRNIKREVTADLV